MVISTGGGLSLWVRIISYAHPTSLCLCSHIPDILQMGETLNDLFSLLNVCWHRTEVPAWMLLAHVML